MSESIPAISDDEIVAGIFRLAKSGRFHHVEPLLQEAESMYPSEPGERIKACLKRLGEILWDADYQGFATEFRHQRRPKPKGLFRAAN